MTVTQARTGGPGVAEAARAALDQAAGHLLGLQHSQGWWQGELETNVTMDAEDLLLREFLGVRTAEETSAAARWIRSCQRADGTWANFRGGDADLSTTVEAYVALRLAGDAPDAGHMSRAAGWIRASGGIPATRVFTRIWLALFGEWSSRLVPAQRVRLGLLGTPDHRAAHHRRLAAPGPAAALRPERAAAASIRLRAAGGPGGL